MLYHRMLCSPVIENDLELTATHIKHKLFLYDMSWYGGWHTFCMCGGLRLEFQPEYQVFRQRCSFGSPNQCLAQWVKTVYHCSPQIIIHSELLIDDTKAIQLINVVKQPLNYVTSCRIHFIHFQVVAFLLSTLFQVLVTCEVRGCHGGI